MFSVWRNETKTGNAGREFDLKVFTVFLKGREDKPEISELKPSNVCVPINRSIRLMLPSIQANDSLTCKLNVQSNQPQQIKHQHQKHFHCAALNLSHSFIHA